MIIGLNVSLQKKWPTSFSNEPATGGSMTPELLATQYKLHNLVLGIKEPQREAFEAFALCLAA